MTINVSSSNPLASAPAGSLSVIIHEPCGSLLTVSGRSTSALLMAVTSPPIGLNSSDTAFTDSIERSAADWLSAGVMPVIWNQVAPSNTLSQSMSR